MLPRVTHCGNKRLLQVTHVELTGAQRLVTETGAGQWGSAPAMSCAMFGLKCRVVHGPGDLRPKTRTKNHDANLCG